jgi:ABC-2 type transport system ATP-binding protein
MIEIKGLTQVFGSKTALSDVNLTIKQGGIIGLIGPNGSGKSTIIKSIMGILKPTKGSILIDGEEVNRQISRKIAYMSDINELFLPTVQDNIDYLVNLYPDYDVNLVMSIINSIHIDLNMNIKGLSKGQCVIIRFALTVGRKVNYIILDEPLNGLDPVFRDSFINRLALYRQQNPSATIIITSHMLKEIQDLLDEVVAVYFSKILAHEEKQKILDHSKDLESWFKQEYINAGISF